MSAAASLHKAVFRRLYDDRTLLSVMGGPKVFRAQPEQALAPYVVLDELETQALAPSRQVEQHRFALSVWSRPRKTSEMTWMTSRISWLLSRNQPFVMSGYELEQLDCVGCDTALSVDGSFNRATIHFNALTRQALNS